MLAEREVNTFDIDVLIIDDSPEDRHNVRRLLNRNKSGATFFMREAETGAVGMRLCAEEMPDCLILDYALGDTDALDFLAELNAGRDPDIDPICPVVILTGAGAVADVAVAALTGGAQDYLSKESLTSEAITRAVVNAIEKVGLRRDLRAAEARFRLSLDNMLDSFGIYRAVRDRHTHKIIDFKCEYLNAAAQRDVESATAHHLGHIPKGDLLSTHWAAQVIDEYLQLIETGESIDNTQLYFMDDGIQLKRAIHRRAWKMSDGFAVAWRDVTDRVIAEENLRIIEQELTLERAKVAFRQQEVSETVQRSLLLAPTPNAYDNLTVQLLYKSASDEALVGGDFFDAFSISNGSVALVVGDATGHGVESAAFTAEVKFAFRAFLREHRGNLFVALHLLNHFMLENQHRDSQSFGFYVALSAAVVNTSTGESSFCCAGGEPPLILRRGSGEVVVSCGFGSLLGASDQSDFPVSTQNLASGDLIAITSDGITEARSYIPQSPGKRPRIRFLGLDGLAAILREEVFGTTQDLAELEHAVIKRVFSPPQDGQHDDVCLLLARRN